jgi:hypothetical protein
MLKRERPDVLKDVAGILFFGTPFRGVSGALNNGGLEAEAKRLQREVRPEILNVIKTGNEHLEDIFSEFNKLKNPEDWFPTICCYHEEVPARVWLIVDVDKDRVSSRAKSFPHHFAHQVEKEIVVEAGSARLDYADIKRAISRDHFSMNKFSKHNDQAYEEIVKDDIVEVIQNWDQRPHQTQHEALNGGAVEIPQKPSRRPSWLRPLFPRPPTRAPRASDSEIQQINDPPVTDTERQSSSVRQASSMRQPSVFISPGERPLPHFEMFDQLKESKLDLKVKKIGIKKVLACGISSDAQRVFMCGEDKLVFYSIDAIGNGNLEHISLPSVYKWELRSAKMTSSFLVAIYDNRVGTYYCRLYRVPDVSPVPILRLPNNDTRISVETGQESQYECVAMHQSSDFVLVALAENSLTKAKASEYARIHLYKIFPDSETQLTQHTLLSLVPLQDENDVYYHRLNPQHGLGKFLTFSSDGSLLIYCSGIRDQYADGITVWKITHTPGRVAADVLCDKIHRYTQVGCSPH